MEATIEIDDGLIPDGYEAVAFRDPLPGEEFISFKGDVMASTIKEPGHPRLIVRRQWEWPSWLTCRAIAKDASGDWTLWLTEIPTFDGTLWHSDENIIATAVGAVDTSSFPSCEAKDSLRINPKWKESQ